MADRLTMQFRRIAEHGIAQVTGVNYALREERRMANQDQRFFNEERAYQRAGDRLQMAQERYGNNPTALERAERQYEMATQRYERAYQARYGTLPPVSSQGGRNNNGQEQAQAQQVSYKPEREQESRQPEARANEAVVQNQDTDFKPWTGFENVPAGRGTPQEQTVDAAPKMPELQPIVDPAPVELLPIDSVPTDSSMRPRLLQEVSAGPFKLPSQEAKVLQAGLNLMGIEAGPVDGVIGPKTKAGLIQYIADKPELARASSEEILARVRSDMRNNPNVQTKMMDVISDNGIPERQDVMAVQVGLNDLAGTGLKVDGKVGLETSRAVIGYLQTSYDSMLLEADPNAEKQLPSNEPPSEQPKTQAPVLDSPEAIVRNTAPSKFTFT